MILWNSAKNATWTGERMFGIFSAGEFFAMARVDTLQDLL